MHERVAICLPSSTRKSLSCRKRELLSAESTAKETLVESKAGELVYACASAISSISQTLTGVRFTGCYLTEALS